jgi:hypothetical protein
MSTGRRHQFRRLPHLGGSVSVSHLRDRAGEGDDAFAISWHSNSGDLCWLSPRIPSQESADIAAEILTSFTGAVKR